MGAVWSRVRDANKSQWLVVAAMTVNTISTFCASLAFPGRTNKDISDKNRVLLTPPGWAFAIWGIIFMWEWVFTAWQLLYSANWSSNKANLVSFVVMCVVQAAWALCFPFELMRLCFALLFINWAALLVINIQGVQYCRNTAAGTVEHDDTHPLGNDHRCKCSTGDRDCDECQLRANETPTGRMSVARRTSAALGYWAVAVAPMGIHLGWLTAATGLGLSIMVARESTTLAPQLTASVTVGSLVACTALARSVVAGDVSVGGALVWALVAISKRDTALPVRVGMTHDTSTVSVPPVVADGLTGAASALAVAVGVLSVVGCVVRFCRVAL